MRIIFASIVLISLMVGFDSAAQDSRRSPGQPNIDVAANRTASDHFAYWMPPPPTDLSDKVVAYAAGKMGQTVGRGECTDLVDAALAAAGARPGNNYIWGTRIPLLSRLDRQRIRRGDIIQFWDAHYTSPNGSTWGTAPGGHHTSIVEAAYGTRVRLIHQNDATRTVTRRDLDLGWKHTGNFMIYRPARRS